MPVTTVQAQGSEIRIDGDINLNLRIHNKIPEGTGDFVILSDGTVLNFAFDYDREKWTASITQHGAGAIEIDKNQPYGDLVSVKGVIVRWAAHAIAYGEMEIDPDGATATSRS